MKLRRSFRPLLDRLEDRAVPASWGYGTLNGLITITQVTDLAGANNKLIVQDNNTSITLTDDGAGGNTVIIPVGVTSVRLNLLNNVGSARTVTWDQMTNRSGDVSLYTNSGDEIIQVNENGGTKSVGGNFTVCTSSGDDNVSFDNIVIGKSLIVSTGTSIFGDSVTLRNVQVNYTLSVTTGSGDDTVSLGFDPNNPGDSPLYTNIASNATINMGNGTGDKLYLGTDQLPDDINTKARIGGTLNATGVNVFRLDAGSTILGDCLLNSSGKSASDTDFKFLTDGGNANPSKVSGNVSVTIGNDGGSSTLFQGKVTKGVTMNIGNGPTDTVLFDTTANVGGNLSITGGSQGKSITLADDSIIGGTGVIRLGDGLFNPNTVDLVDARFGGSLQVYLGNTFDTFTGNVLDLSGTFVGGPLSVYGGAGNDTVETGTAATRATYISGAVTLTMGNGDNIADFVTGSIVGGTSFRYTGGTGSDTVNYFSNSYVAFYATFSTAPAGTTKTVNLGIRPSSVYIDFGFGTGTKTFTPSGNALPPGYTTTVKNQ